MANDINKEQKNQNTDTTNTIESSWAELRDEIRATAEENKEAAAKLREAAAIKSEAEELSQTNGMIEPSVNTFEYEQTAGEGAAVQETTGEQVYTAGEYGAPETAEDYSSQDDNEQPPEYDNYTSGEEMNTLIDRSDSGIPAQGLQPSLDEDVQPAASQEPSAQSGSQNARLTEDDAWEMIKGFLDHDNRRFEPVNSKKPDEPRKEKNAEVTLTEQRLLAKTLLLKGTEKETYLADFEYRVNNPDPQAYAASSGLEEEIYNIVKATDGINWKEKRLDKRIEEAYPAILPNSAAVDRLKEAVSRSGDYRRSYDDLQPPIDGISIIKAGDKVILNIRKNVTAADIANFNTWKRENRDLLVLAGRGSMNGISISLKSGNIMLTDEMAVELRRAVTGNLPYFEMKSGSMTVDPDSKKSPLKILLNGTSQLHVWGKEPFSLSYEKDGRVINPLLDISGLTVTYGTATASYNSEKKTLTPQITEIGAGPAVRSVADMQYGDGAVSVRANSMAQNYVNLDPAVRDSSIAEVDSRSEAFMSYKLKTAYGSAFRDLISLEPEYAEDGETITGYAPKYTEADWSEYAQSGSGKIADWIAKNKEAVDYYAKHSVFIRTERMLNTMKKTFSAGILLRKDLLLSDEVLRRAYGLPDDKLEDRRKKVEAYLGKNEVQLYNLITKDVPPFKLGTLCRVAIDYEREATALQNAVIEERNLEIAKENEKNKAEGKPLKEELEFVTERRIVNFDRLSLTGKFMLLEDNLFTETVRKEAPVFASENFNNLEDALRASILIQKGVRDTLDRDKKILENALKRMKNAEDLNRPEVEKEVEKELKKNIDLELTLAERTARELCADPETILKPGLRTPDVNEKLTVLGRALKEGTFEKHYNKNINGIKDLVTAAYNGDLKADADDPRIVAPETFKMMVEERLHSEDIEDAEEKLAIITSGNEFNARMNVAVKKRSEEINGMVEKGVFWQEYDNNTDGLKDLLIGIYGEDEFEKLNPAESNVVAKYSNRENYLVTMSRDIEYKLKAVTKAADKKDELNGILNKLESEIKEIEGESLGKVVTELEKLKYDNVGNNTRDAEIKAKEAERKEIESRLGEMKDTRNFLDKIIKQYNEVASVQNLEFADQFYNAYVTSEKLYGNAEEKTDRLGNVFVNTGNISVNDAGLAGRSFAQVVNNPLRYNELIKKHAKNIAAGMAEIYKGYNSVVNNYDNPERFFRADASGVSLVDEYKKKLGGVLNGLDDSNGFIKFKLNIETVENAERELRRAWQNAFDTVVSRTDGKIHSGDTLREICEDEGVKKALADMEAAYAELRSDTIKFKDGINEVLVDMYYDLKTETRKDFLDAVSPDGGMCILKDGNQENSVVNTCLPLKLIQGFDVFDAIAKDENHTLCIGQGTTMNYGALYGTKGVHSVVQWLDDAYKKEYEDIKARNKDEKMKLRTLLDTIISFCSNGDKKSSEGISFEKFAELIDRKDESLDSHAANALKAVVKQKIYDLDQITAWEKLNPELEDYIALLSAEGVKLRNAWTKAKTEESDLNNDWERHASDEEKYKAHIRTEKAKAAYEEFKHHRKSEFGRWVYNNSDVAVEASNSVPNGEEEVYVNEKLDEPLKVTTNEGTMRTVTGTDAEQKGYKNSEIFAAKLALFADSFKKGMPEFMRGWHRVSVPEALLWIIIGTAMMTTSIIKLPANGLKYVRNNNIAEKNAALRAALGTWVENSFDTITDENLKVVGLKPKAEFVEKLAREGVSVKDGGRTIRVDLEKSSAGRFTGVREFNTSVILNLKNKDDAEALMKKLAAEERKARGWLLEKKNEKVRKEKLVYRKIEENRERIDQAYAEDNNNRKHNLVTNSGKINPDIEAVDLGLDKGKGFTGTKGYSASTQEPVNSTGKPLELGRGGL